MNDLSGLPDRLHNQPPEAIVMPTLPGEATLEQVKRAKEAAEAARTKADDKQAAYDDMAHAELNAHVSVFCDAAGKWLDIKTVQTVDQAERLTDFITGARGLFKRVEDARKAAKKPWDDLGAEVQEAFTPLTAKLDKLGKTMKAMQGDWLRRESDRLAREKAKAEAEARAAREEAERLAREAAERNDIAGQVEAEAALKQANKAEKVAAKPVKARAGSATGGGRAMGMRKIKAAKITNIRACFAYFQADPAVSELLTRLATAAVRSGEITQDTAVIAGIDIIETEGV